MSTHATSHSPPFKFLDYYEKEDKEVYGFFGRDEDIDRLHATVTANRFTLIYGLMGVGKTSLVKCGLANKFDESQWLEVYVRRGKNFKESLRNKLNGEVEKHRSVQSKYQNTQSEWRARLQEKFVVKAPPPTEPDSTEISKSEEGLFQVLEQLYLHSFKPIYLIFDQFEEIFALGDTQEQEDFFGFLEEFQTKKKLELRVLIIMREEYFAYIDRYRDALPNLIQNRFRVENLRETTIKEIIINTLDKRKIRYDPVAIDHILENLSPDAKDIQKNIELTYMQVYLDRLYQKAQNENPEQTPVYFDQTIVEKVGPLKNALEVFLKNQVSSINHQMQRAKAPQQESPAYDSAQEELTWKILKQLVSNQGTRQPVTLEDLISKIKDAL